MTVSIITVLYNEKFNIKNTIESILSQKVKKQIIIIDGKSDDGTLDILKKYEKHIDVIISEQDEGIYFAMNKGLSFVKGDFISFMNAGDTYYNCNSLEILASSIKDNVSIIYGDLNRINGKSMKYISQNKVINEHNICHQSMLYRSDFFTNNKFNTTFSVSADYEILSRARSLKNKCQYIPVPVVNYLSNGYSESNKIKARVEDLMIDSMYHERIEDIFDKNSFIKTYFYSTKFNVFFPHEMKEFIKQVIKYSNSEIDYSLYGYGLFCNFLIKYSNFKYDKIYDRDFRFKNKTSNHTILSPDSINKNDKQHFLITAIGHETTIKSSLLEKGIDSKKISTFFEVS